MIGRSAGEREGGTKRNDWKECRRKRRRDKKK